MKANSMNASGGPEAVGAFLLLIMLLLGVCFLPSFMARRTPRVVEQDKAPIRRQLDSLLRSFGKVAPPVRAGTLELLYAEQNFAGMLGWIKNSLRLELGVGLRIISQPEASAPPMWIEVPK